MSEAEIVSVYHDLRDVADRLDAMGARQDYYIVSAARCEIDSLRASLLRAEEEIERLRGFEPCNHKGSADRIPCFIERRYHDARMAGFSQHKSVGKTVHEFVSGAFDAALIAETEDLS